MFGRASVPCIERQVFGPFDYLQRGEGDADVWRGPASAKTAIATLCAGDAAGQIKAQFNRAAVTGGFVYTHLRFTSGMREADRSYLASG